MADIRQFMQADLLWIKPIAQKYDQWEFYRDAIFSRLGDRVLLGAWVIEGKAMVALIEDIDEPKITTACGLCDQRGIKELFQIARAVYTMSQGFGLTLHSPELEEGSWQTRFFTKLNFKSVGNGRMMLPAGD